MRTRDIQAFESANRRAVNAIIFSMIGIAIGVMLYTSTIGVYYNDTQTVIILVVFGVLFVGGWAGVIFGIAFYVRLGRYERNYFGWDDNTDDGEVDADMLDDWHRRMAAEVAVPDVSIVTSDDTQIRISRTRLTRRQWRTLATRLSENDWNWRRRFLKGIVKNYTAKGVYPEMTRDLERVKIVERGKVTTAGREAICEAAGLDVVI
jgi:hypothetical protein